MQSSQQDKTMASPGPSSALAAENLRGFAAPVNPAHIQNLEEELALQQAILVSLEDTFESAETVETKIATKRSIVKLKKQLSEARGVVAGTGI